MYSVGQSVFSRQSSVVRSSVGEKELRLMGTCIVLLVFSHAHTHCACSCYVLSISQRHERPTRSTIPTPPCFNAPTPRVTECLHVVMVDRQLYAVGGAALNLFVADLKSSSCMRSSSSLLRPLCSILVCFFSRFFWLSVSPGGKKKEMKERRKRKVPVAASYSLERHRARQARIRQSRALRERP